MPKIYFNGKLRLSSWEDLLPKLCRTQVVEDDLPHRHLFNWYQIVFLGLALNVDIPIKKRGELDV